MSRRWRATHNRLRLTCTTLAVDIGSQVLPAVLFGDVDFGLSLLGLLQNVLAVVTVRLVVAICARYVDHRRIAEYGLEFGSEWSRDMGAGVVIAVLAWGLALVVHFTAGWAHLSAVFAPGHTENALPFTPALVVFSAQFLLVGVWEELLFRVLVLKNAAEGPHTRWVTERSAVLAGLGASSLLFGIVHANQTTSLLALGFWVLMGVVLGSAYILTDSLTLPIGLHFATDLAFNSVCGLNNVRPEAAEVVATLLRPEFTGPLRLVGVSGLVNVGVVVLLTSLGAASATVQYGPVGVGLSPVYGTELTE